jgi:hypothetical protein
LGSSYAFDEEEGVDPKIPPVVLPFAAQQPAAPARQSLQVMIDAVQAQALRSALSSCPPQLSPLPFKTFSTTRTSSTPERLFADSLLRLTPTNSQHSPTQQLDNSTKQQLNKSQ